MKTYSGSKKGAARFARKAVEALNPDCASIMIITRDLLEVFSASTVIEGSLDDIGRLMEKSSSKQLPPISEAPTPDTLPQPKRKPRERKEDAVGN